MTVAIHILVSACVIGFAGWLAGRYPITAGFLVALPLATMLVLPISYHQHGDPQAAVTLARSIFAAIPVSLGFFVPFLLANRLGLGFWQAYALGCVVLVAGFALHRVLVRAIFT